MSLNGDVTKNDKAWSCLFSKYKIPDRVNCEGFFEITARQINEFREARLMTKFDHRVNLPRLFSEHNLAILPVTRGSYVISQFDAYKEFEPIDDAVAKVPFPEHIQSIDHENITSEATALNCAYVSGILADFLEDDNLLPTVSGRMSSGSFSFLIRNRSKNSDFNVEVTNSQIEIDGGFEGTRQLAVIEAKNFISDDFLIRQIYYPYRLWRDKVSKKITPVFMVYSNGVFSLYEYEFTDPGHYNSLVLVKKKNYSIDAEDIVFDDIVDVLGRVKIVEEPEIPFPQADSFRRIINLCELLSENQMTRDEITLNYAFAPRQTNYYTDAGRYLGLIHKCTQDRQIVFSLTDKGNEIIRSKYKRRQLGFVESIMEHKVFNEVLRLCQERKMASRAEVVRIMRNAGLYGVSAESTYKRRSSTVVSWINWILELQR